MMDPETLNYYTRLCSIFPRSDWKKSLDAFFVLLRKKFIFDNLAIYLSEKRNTIPEVIFARAVGRGRNKGSEASWGEEIASQVIFHGEAIESTPVIVDTPDRTRMPFLLGLPFSLGEQVGALVFVRFGGPGFTEDQMPLASLAVTQVTHILKQRNLIENQVQLEHARHRAQLQDDFIAIISHELRTPLGFIKGYSTSLLRADTTWDMETQREFLTIIDEESDHLLLLIDRMLDSARLQSGSMPMDFQPMRLDVLLRDVAQHARGRHDSLDVELQLVPVPPIQADSVRIAQVFENLFDNAMKYAPGSKLTLSLQLGSEYQVVTFSDQGPGISQDHIPFLFERFYRVPSQTRQAGTGLGLFICRQIVQAHGGKISLESSPGKGTCFMIELPLTQVKASQEG